MQRIFIDDISPGDVIARDIFSSEGRMLISKGTIFREHFAVRLEEMGIEEIYINSDNDDSDPNIEIENLFSDTEKSKIAFDIENDIENEKVHIDDIIYERTRLQAQIQVKKMMVRFGSINHSNLEKVHNIVDEVIEQLLSKKDIVLTLSKLRSIDDYTYEHSVNVCVLSLIVGIDLNIDKDSLKKLGIGAILHDIGKVGISENIIKKPTRLSQNEFEDIKKHTEYGYEILRRTNVSEEAAQIALYHHERYDGTGYPEGLKGEEIPLFSRIVAVADVYDAISNDRVYKKKLSPDKVFRQLAQLANKHFDASIMEMFVRHINLYPTGIGVVLNTNHKGIVIAQNKLLPESPKIRLFKRDKTDLKNLYVDVDLSLTKFLYIKDTF
jgi:putative nucleotidyltransferase with HDIG domain